jgi:hypothetical protein
MCAAGEIDVLHFNANFIVHMVTVLYNNRRTVLATVRHPLLTRECQIVHERRCSFIVTLGLCVRGVRELYCEFVKALCRNTACRMRLYDRSSAI